MLLNFGLSTRGIGATIKNACFTFGNDGIIIWYGYRSATFGTITPDNINGLSINAFEYQADGTMRLKLGVAGNEQLPGISNIVATSSDQSQYTALVWSSINLAYEAIDLSMTTYLIAKVNECINFSKLPDTFIEYDMQVKIN